MDKINREEAGWLVALCWLSALEETDQAAYFDYTDTVYFAAPSLAMASTPAPS